LLVVFAFVLFRRKPGRQRTTQAEYIAGLHALLAGDQEEALQRFRQVVRRDTDFLDAYIHIGNIFRSKGGNENAIKVHRDLLIRPNLNIDDQKEILQNLALDYYHNNQTKWALSTCDKLLDLDKKNDWARQFKLDLYEKMGDWQGAFDTLKKNSALNKEEKNSRLAVYKVEQGLQLHMLGQEHDARLRYREAIKQHSQCFPAFMKLVESYFKEQRGKDALRELKRLIEAVPDYADVALTSVENNLYEMGHFEEIENFYVQLIKSHPQILQTYLGLAQIYEKKGEFRKGIEVCNRALQQDPKHVPITLKLIEFENKLHRYEHSAKLFTQLAETLQDKKSSFVCRQCGHGQETYFWHCPSCRTWNSAERR